VPTATARRRSLARFLIGFAGVVMLLLWFGICAYQSYIAGWVGSSGSQCSDPHRIGPGGAFWRVVISGIAIPTVAGLSVFSRASLAKGADRWYWVQAMLIFAIGGFMAGVLWFLSLAAWYSANPGVVDSDAWRPILRFIISGTEMAPWTIGIIACIIVGVRTSTSLTRKSAAISAAAIVLVLEAVTLAGYLALLAYFCA
jgi:hypothetical protein